MDLLQVKDGQIVDQSATPIRWRGTAIGGWMNMENFINGYPGAESSLREEMARTIGEQKALFFFERLLDHFFTEEDVKYMKEAGATAVRIPLNYRHFESDREPFVYDSRAFARLDRAIDWCARHDLYAILDLHAVQGWQNTDWHCDNTSRHSLFWTNRHFQDRFVALWEELARHYRDVPAVAAYNVMNEPLVNEPRGRMDFLGRYEPRWEVINGVYRRVVNAIRAIDPHHIIVLEGDYFSGLFDGLEPPFTENLVYSCHNYSGAGFGPGPYPGLVRGKRWDREAQVEDCIGRPGYKFAQEHNVPLWVGEFGAAYNGPKQEIPDRERAMDDQLGVFEEHEVHWSTWVFKDAGVMGMIELDPESEYMKLIEPITNARYRLGTDFWMKWIPAEGREKVREIAEWTMSLVGEEEFSTGGTANYMSQALLSGYAARMLQKPFCKLFRGMSEDELDRILSAFRLENGVPHHNLVEIMRKHMAEPASKETSSPGV